MTVIIKSDKKASASLGNLNGIKGPSDWAIFLDFENEVYSTKSTDVLKKDYALTDVVEVARINLNGAPISISKAGVEKAVTSVAEIRTALLKNGRFGLLAEDVNENFFLNSSAPVSQTIFMPAASSRLLASCEGSGSLTITGDIVGGPIVITKDTPQVFERSVTTTACTLNIAVSGTLTHAQIEIATGSHTASSKIKTGSTSTTRPRELVKLKPALFNSIINNRSAFTAVLQTIDYNPVINPLQHSANRFGFESGTDYKLLKMAGIHTNKNYLAFNLQYINSTSTTTQQVFIGAFDSSKRFYPYTQAVAISGGIAMSAINGTPDNTLAIVNPFSVTNIAFGYGYSSPIGQNGLRGIVTKCLIYDRVLTQAELNELSKSWG